MITRFSRSIVCIAYVLLIPCCFAEMLDTDKIVLNNSIVKIEYKIESTNETYVTTGFYISEFAYILTCQGSDSLKIKYSDIEGSEHNRYHDWRTVTHTKFNVWKHSQSKHDLSESLYRINAYKIVVPDTYNLVLLKTSEQESGTLFPGDSNLVKVSQPILAVTYSSTMSDLAMIEGIWGEISETGLPLFKGRDGAIQYFNTRSMKYVGSPVIKPDSLSVVGIITEGPNEEMVIVPINYARNVISITTPQIQGDAEIRDKSGTLSRKKDKYDTVNIWFPSF